MKYNDSSIQTERKTNRQSIKKDPKTDRCWIWGAGDSGIEVFSQIEHPCGTTWRASQMEGFIEGFIDSNSKLQGRQLFGRKIISPMEFAEIHESDKELRVVITPAEAKAKAEIYHALIEMGVTKSHISFRVGGYFDLRFEVLRQFAEFAYDQKIPGNVAECGVYRGYFAAKMNRCFYDKRLYLFDSFKGFDERDINCERDTGEEGFLSGGFNKVGLFSNTLVNEVIANMPFVDNIVIKKGWVPETFIGVEDQFCFVNLDMDLYQPMHESLRFFWDKMVLGGMILCHDYLLNTLPGVKKAIFDFEKEYGRFIPKTTVGDGCSIALIKD